MSELDMSEVGDRVTAVLQRSWSGAAMRPLQPLEGGHSGLTLVAEVENAPVDRVVVKLAPPGREPVGRHDVVRQGRLLTAIRHVPGVRVPTIYGADEAPPPLVLMEWVEGEAVEPILDAPAVVVPSGDADQRARAAARMLAHLHSIDPGTVAPSEDVTDWRDERERWVPTMQTVDPALRTRAPELLERLRSVSPRPLPAAILHGDYRLGNLQCRDGEVRAIIDWEIWSVGDPRVDLGWFLVFTDTKHLPGASAPAPGMPTASELLAEYEAVRGEPVEDMDWFDALARYKMAAIMGNNLQRHREGRYHDPYQERLPDSIVSLIDQGIDLLGARPI